MLSRIGLVRILVTLWVPLVAGSSVHAAEQLFSVDGAPQTEEHLPPTLQQALFDARLQHYKKQLEIIDRAVLELAIESRAEATGQSAEEETTE